MTIVVEASERGKRLDLFLADHLPRITRSQVKRLIAAGAVRGSNKILKPAHAVSPGEVIEVVLPPLQVSHLVPEAVPLAILFEDRDILVLDKPAGMVVHPGAGVKEGTLVNALLHHCHDLSGIGGTLRPGIVHRLDKGTSGVMVVAKNDTAHLALSRQFAERRVSKMYAALVVGTMKGERGRYDAPLGRSKRDRKKISSRTAKGRRALTSWTVAERFPQGLTWLHVELFTGRTHQIRVHLSEAGYPLVGDTTYGGDRKGKMIRDPSVRNLVTHFPRPALHAWRLGIVHPRTGKVMSFEAPLPFDLQELLQKCR